jgi:CHAT domain-containing protein/Tfp pilus assembly protein PilF
MKSLILEVFSYPDCLKMGLFEKGSVDTVRDYETSFVSMEQIEKLNEEIIRFLNRANKNEILQANLREDLQKSAQVLFDQLLTPSVKERLKTFGSGRNLVLSLDEQLVNIPWELLYDGEDFLCLKFNLARNVRIQQKGLKVAYRPIQPKYKMLILADPTGDLAGAYKEGIFIRNQVDKKRRFVEADLKTTHIDTTYVKKNLRDYDIVHFAGHSNYEGLDSKNNGWVLADGLLSSADLINMAQSGPMPAVIFSNACQSAYQENKLDFGSENRLYGLVNTFLLSGVRHYLGTLWRVQDLVSLEFAHEFYRHFIQKDEGIGQALRAARLALVDRYGPNSIAWASYILYGDPAFAFSTAAEAGVSPPAPSIKKRLRICRKNLLRLGLAAAVIVTFLVLYNILPTINPSTYILFAKSKRLFEEGKNQRVVALCQRIINQDKRFVLSYKMLGDIYFRLGDNQRSLKNYFDYARLSEKRADKKNLASAQIKIAWVYHMQGDYAKAREFYEQAIALSRKNKDKLNEADAISRLAVWYMDKWDYEKALLLLMKSSEINRPRQHISKYRFNLACDYFNIAYIYTDKDDYKAAKEFYDKSAKLFEGLKETAELSDYYFNMGEIASFEKKYQKAMDLYAKGMQIDLRLGHRFNLSSDYGMLADLYGQMGRIEEAKEYFQKSIELCKQIHNLPVLADSYHCLGLLYKDIGDKKKARQLLQYSMDIYKKMDTPDYQDVRQDYLSIQ